MAITVNYEWPVAVPGSTTPAPSNQPPPTNVGSSVRFNQVTALLSGDGAATSVTITHNLEITAQELSEYWPEVRFEPIVSGGPTGFWVEARATNTVTVGFATASATSVGGFGVVRINREYSPGR
jgi:hypothetical protein